MKLLTLLLTACLMIACSKNAKFDGRKVNPTNPTGAGVDVESPAEEAPVATEEYKSSVEITADILYSFNGSSYVRMGGSTGVVSVVNEGFKIPQELEVTEGWAGKNDTATITIAHNSETIVCTYQSKSTSKSHKSVSNTTEENDLGMSYAFSNCTDTTVDPTVVVDSFDSVTLKVVKADNLMSKTTVKAEVKLYQ